MAEINSTEVIVQPIVPKAVDNQQVIVYIPTANTGSYGAIKLETDDLNPDIIAVNGIIQLRNGRVLQTKVDVIEVPECVYATPNTFIPYTEFASENTIVYRNEDGNFNSGDAKLDSNVVNLRVLKQEIGKALVEYDSINIQNGTGENSLIQKAPDGKENTAAMEGGIAFGKNSHANQKYDFAIGANAIAGFTKEQFNSYYWDGTQALHGGKGKDSDGNILDFTGSKYEDSFGYNFAVGDTAIANGRNAVAFQQGKAYGRESVAFGTATADGEQSFAINNGYASGYDSFSQGSNTVAKYAQQAVFGRWNENKEDDIFEVGVGSGEPDPIYGLPETKNAFEITKAGKVKVLNEPSENNEVVRKQELDTKYDKTGGTIGGNVIITGDLTVNGTQHINNTENLNVENAMIYSNAKGATLTTNGGIGIKKNATDVYGIVYDPTSDSVKLGLGKSDSNGKFTFNANEGQPVAIRDDSSLLVNNNLVKWDAANHKLVDSGKSIEDLTAQFNSLNILNGSGENSIKQKPDGDTFKGQQKGTTTTDIFVDYDTDAAGQNSTILGGKNRAEAKRATAIGGYNVAAGASSLATGEQTITEGRCSFTAGQKTRAAGWSSMAIGTSTVAAGNTAFSGGIKTIASGDYSVSFGSNTLASGLASFAIGNTSQSKAHASFSGGIKNLVTDTATAGDALGGYNTVESRYASARGASNFIKASYPTDVSGGGGSGTGGSGGETTQPTEELQPGLYSSVEGNRNTVYGAWSHAQGSNNVIYSHSSSAEGYNNIVGKPVTSLADAGEVTASMHAEGANNKVTGNYSHVGGYESVVSGEKSFAHGQYNNVSGNASAAFGGTNSVSGNFSVAFGSQNTVGGINCLVAGSDNTISKNDRTQNSIVAGSRNLADYSNGLVVGNGLVLTNDNQAVFGTYNTLNSNALLMVCNGTSERNRSNAFEVLNDGRAKVQTRPVDDNDVVRKLELDSISSNRAVTINAPASATQGTLTEEQLSILQAGDNNYIIFNNEIYRLADKQHTTGILSYTHIGWTGTAMQDKSINITISTLAWTLVIGQEGGGGTNVVANPGTGTTRITDIQIGNTKYYILPKKYEQYLKDNTFVAPNVQLNVTFITSTVKDGKYLYKQLVACNISHKEIQNDATLLKNLTLYLRGTAIANDIPVSLDTVATILSSYSFTTDTSTNIFKLLLPYNNGDTEQSVYAEKVVDAGYALWYGAGDAPSRLDSTNIKNVISKGTKNISVTTTASQKITILFPGTVTAKTNASFSTEIPLTKTGTVQLPIYSGSSGTVELAGAVIYNIYQTEPLKAGTNDIILTLGGN